MKKKYIYIIGILLSCWLIWISTTFFIKIELNGAKTIYLEPNEEYIEKGAQAYFFRTRLAVVTSGTVNTKIGKRYDIYYMARNPLGIVKKVKRTVIVKDKNSPKITLRGSQTMFLKVGDTYKEPGYEAIDLEDGNITNQVIVKKDLKLDQVGSSQITYTVSDKSGNKKTVTRIIRTIPKELLYQDRYDNIDNTSRGWGHGNKKNHQREVADVAQEDLAPYSAYYMGPDEKVIYLTFDEGSNDTYTKEIFQVLKDKNVKATFFFCKNYIASNADLMKELVKDKQVVGNHTARHKMMPTLANRENYEAYKKEIQETEQTFKKVTGKDIAKVYREPAGEWSYRSLALVQDMGYRTYFWSAAYVDFAGDLSKEDALDKMMQLYHNGAIYLIHPKNKGNYLALGDFIDKMKSLGYRFDTVDKIE